ncbi:hypothetical protein OIU34_18780 [Pararhizobium sp. BT-229]|uniref:hypothetical protein n=1 Tax=Pararhizobium sp. BT-229 TaxID=2986923 RepID=UPI0021F76EA7|nr:hypothetical protein [Pararhizobium sp. BT-229]MCV9963926.1 hypothetical protein [Pararhizobium sp. BT-229]
MDTETLLRAKLEEWGVDTSDPEKTLWSSIQAYPDGFMNLYALEVEDAPRDRNFRVYRLFPGGNQAHLSVDLEIPGKTFATADRDRLPFDNGERGDFSEFRDAIKAELGGDFVFVWADEGEPYLSFVGRTVRVGGEERVVCGQCERTDNGIKVEVDFDRPLSAVLNPAPRRAQAKPAAFA